jgi:formate dehydrogenase
VASEKTVHTYCRICLATCGLEVTVDEAANRVVSIEPDRQNPYTWRDFCRKGKTADEIVSHPRRITTPLRRVGEHYEPASYAEAIGDIARRLNEIIERGGPDAVGSYHGNPMGFSFSSQAFWNGLLDAIGTGNRFWVGSVDQNDGHVVNQEMYGSELVSLPPDIDPCEHFLLVGMDPAVTKFNWMDNCPDGWNRILAKQSEGTAEVVIVDPRRSRSAARASRHLAVLPGQDWALLLALVKVILEEGRQRPSTTVPTKGLDALRALVASTDLRDLAARCGIEAETLAEEARRFAGARTAMCLTHTGVAHNEHGTVGEWLGHVLNLVTDRMDVPGGKRHERGVVDMAKILERFAPASTHRTRLRDLPPIAGFHSLSELPDEITTPGPGQIRAMLIAFGNPVTSGPHGAALDAALSQLDLLVAFDLVQRESHRHADWLLPGTHWLEREEFSPLFSGLQERPFIQYPAKVVDAPEGVMEEWELFTELALAMDRNMFGQPGVNRIIRASRRVAETTGRAKLAFNPDWMARAMLAMGRRVRWRDIMARPHGYRYAEQRFGDLRTAVATPDKHVQLAPPRLLLAARDALAVAPPTSPELPLCMINRRSRESMNSWLNETPSLWKLGRHNVVEIHPDDATPLGIEDADRVRLVSPVGEIEIAAAVTEDMRPGVVCVPHGWGARIFDPQGGAPPVAHGANRNLLVDNVRIDRLSQTPAFNTTAVRVDLVAKAEPGVTAGQEPAAATATA